MHYCQSSYLVIHVCNKLQFILVIFCVISSCNNVALSDFFIRHSKKKQNKKNRVRATLLQLYNFRKFGSFLLQFNKNVYFLTLLSYEKFVVHVFILHSFVFVCINTRINFIQYIRTFCRQDKMDE